MTDTNAADDLDSILSGFSEAKPTLGSTLENMDAQHFSQVVQAVQTECTKRAPVNVGAMTDAEFTDFKRMNGV